MADAGPALPHRAWLAWLAGGACGAVLLVAGGLTNDGMLLTAGMALLTVTLVLTGVLLIAVGISGCRVRRPSTGGRPEDAAPM